MTDFDRISKAFVTAGIQTMVGTQRIGHAIYKTIQLGDEHSGGIVFEFSDTGSYTTYRVIEEAPEG